MQKKILVILMPNYRDEEFTIPYEMLLKAGHTVDVAGLQPGTAIGANGHKHTPNLMFNALSQTNFDTYDALVIPGGPGSKTFLWGKDAIHKAIKYFYEKKKIVAAICYAVIVVVETGILKGKIATVFPTNEAKEIFKDYDVTFSDQGCVWLKEEKIITAQGPKFAQKFGKAIVNSLQ